MIQFFPPDDRLKGYIKEYWIWEDIPTNDLPWIFPSYEPELVFHKTEPSVLHTDEIKEIFLEKIHLVGPQNRRWKISSSTRMSLLSIRFYPATIYEMFGISGQKILNSFFLPDSIQELGALEEVGDEVTRLSNLKLFSFKKLDKIFLDILSMNRGKEIPAYLKFSMAAFMKENTTVEKVAKQFNITRKQLERKFKETTGFSPKEFQRIHRVLELIRNPGSYKNNNIERKLTDLAYNSAYSDQSHMIKDFKSISGILPKVWLQDYEKMSHFYNSNVSGTGKVDD